MTERHARKSASVVQCQLKLKLRPAQERVLDRWLWRLTGVYNWAVKTVEADAKNRIFRSSYDIEERLRLHGPKVGLPTHTMQATARDAVTAWKRCFKKVSGRPRLKGRRNALNSIPFPDPLRPVIGNSIVLPLLGRVKFHSQDVPAARIKGARLVKRPSGWVLCLFVACEPKPIQLVSSHAVGIDPGFAALFTLSSGEVVDRPVEMARMDRRVAQAQRGRRKRLTARMLERQANQRKDRNHKLSRRIVAENALIAWSKDSHAAMARAGFGKSVASAAHGQLRRMLAYKSSSCGRQFVEVPNRYSTMTCSSCGQRTGPHGRAGLKVRQWVCPCGAGHDRDVNAAINTLNAALGMSVESGRKAASGISI